ncbi:heavy metal transporter [Sedimentibacter sp.]|uniref:heavy metal transporter n=1 Tax=Sedimentibacter sp. TaxID=1960295 RepID=UPI002898BF16|nr:heavy metal transporter [Sedimentibacter sp.]
MNKVHYNVSRLQNTNIKTQLKNVLKDIQGVNMVNIDIGRGSVEVGYDDSTDVDLIRQSIENVGCKIE